MHTVYIGIGSNIGDRRNNCNEAIRLMEASGLPLVKRSSMHETEPWGVEDQPKFINMVIETETDLAPREILRLLKGIEKKMGRRETLRWGPRVIDLDILLCDALIVDEPVLKIPHPSLQEREFVLKPFAEIAPQAIHPVLNKSIRALYEENV